MVDKKQSFFFPLAQIGRYFLKKGLRPSMVSFRGSQLFSANSQTATMIVRMLKITIHHGVSRRGAGTQRKKFFVLQLPLRLRVSARVWLLL